MAEEITAQQQRDAEASTAVSDLDFRTIHDGDHILLDYTPHLHLLYALEALP